MEFLLFLLNKQNIFIILTTIISGLILLITSDRKNNKYIGVLQAINIANEQQAIWIDIRLFNQFRTGHIAQAHNIPIAELSEKSLNIPKNKPLILISNKKQHINQAISILETNGFSKIFVLNGGMKAWNDIYLPIIHNI